MKQLHVTSDAFKQGEMIPSKYTCDGKNISPPPDISNIPRDSKCMALIVDDSDAPIGTWVHWLVWNMPVTHYIKEHEVPGIEGLNDFQQYHYGGPCPPAGIHRYFFKVYALNSLLNLPPGARKLQLEASMKDHILAYGELIGLYKRM